MNAKEYKKHLDTLKTNCSDGATGFNFESSTVYAAPWLSDGYVPFQPDDLLPNQTTITTSTYEPQQEAEYFEMRTDKETRLLLNEIFLWLSGMGEYPELLAQICPMEVVGDPEDGDEEEREKVAERTVAQVLRWVLGEL